MHASDETNNGRSSQLTYKFIVQGGDLGVAGSISTKIKRILQQIGARPDAVRKASVATYEAEMNIAIHAETGEITLTASLDEIRIRCEDKGPGIADIDLAMQPGYSTANDEAREMGFGAGMGLPNMNRCANNMKIVSAVGVGTTVEMVFKNE